MKILRLGGQMHQVICYISLITAGFVLAGCGQSGALHLPADPNHDKRAKYLLYKNTEPAAPASGEKQDAPVRQQFEAPVESDSTSSP